MRVRLHGEDGDLLADAGFGRAGFEHDFEDAIIRNHLDTRNFLRKINQEGDIAERMVELTADRSVYDKVVTAFFQCDADRVLQIGIILADVQQDQIVRFRDHAERIEITDDKIGCDPQPPTGLVSLIRGDHPIAGGRLFGIGCSPSNISYLDRGVISGMIIPNEFTMGYQSLAQLSRCLSNDIPVMKDIEIGFSGVLTEEVHDPENEKLLFPVVQ